VIETHVAEQLLEMLTQLGIDFPSDGLLAEEVLASPEDRSGVCLALLLLGCAPISTDAAAVTLRSREPFGEDESVRNDEEGCH
jgi:hypothetical protein